MLLTAEESRFKGQISKPLTHLVPQEDLSSLLFTTDMEGPQELPTFGHPAAFAWP